MSVAHTTDLNLSQKDVSGLTSADALAGFLAALGYDTSRRQSLTPESIGLAGDSAAAVKRIELLSEDAEGLLRVTFVQLRSLTAKSRNDLARVLGRTNVDHLLILTSDFEVLEFVLLDKQRRAARGPVGNQRIAVVPLSIAISRKGADSRQLRTLRRLTWTARDGLDQFDKLRSVFEAAAFSEDYFCNRALFADHYLLSRLREDAAWRDNPSEPFRQSKQLLADARHRWQGKDAAILRNELYEPIFALLGFDSRLNEAAAESQSKPDYFLAGAGGKTAAFVYPWDRWLDGPDFNLDPHSPEENPGACVVTALDEGVANWIIVTNGRQWRLYSRNAHSRATNFYETDLVEALIASGDTDPNEAFRYWWLFFRAQAFAPPAGREHGCWLDAVAEGSREYAKQLGERLKQRIFVEIFPHLAKGFLEDRRRRIGSEQPISDAELEDTYEATLTLLYRLLFLLYAESRDLLPVREAPYRAASLTKIKQEIAERGGIAESESADRLAKAFSTTDTAIYDRLLRLCAAMDSGDPALNVPVYNGGLFLTRPSDADTREARIARFLAEHKVPDRFLALAIDRVARDPDDKTFALVFIDYKSLEVRHLGSIYEGLLEFKLRVADEDLAARTEKGREKLIPLSAARAKRGRAAEVAVAKGDVYLSNDKSERKASGSYYTPDPIVKYIVENTVGPVLSEKLESFRSDLRKVRKTYDNELAKLRVPPIPREVSSGMQTPEQFAGEKTYLAHRALVDAMFDFRTLDPAMGSGHFLVEAVDFITDRLLTFLSQFPRNPVSFMLERTRRNILEALGEQGIAVDPDKLTEINLLKRHVLKRCIYGVDLNPMAVELAKVSLWLDAFTIGAPLSFLDHHLRCGNSLIGATFKDLEAATKGQLFSIDYEPLLRAIRHVIQINAMADATAAEVKQSASEYTIARRELSGYQIVLDLLVARHFGFPNAAKLLSHYGKQLDLASRGSFMASLEGLEESATAEKVETLATQPDRRFFHWEIEFPEVFFAFADANQRQLKHKNELAAGSAGFDAVVGNPPYDVLAEKELGVALAPLVAFFRQANEFASAHGGKINLYKLFVAKIPTISRESARFGMIVPMPLIGDRQALGLRTMLLNRCRLANVEVFPEHLDPNLRVFRDANLTTCIFIACRTPMRASDCLMVRRHSRPTIEPAQPALCLSKNELLRFDPDNRALPCCSRAEWAIISRIIEGGHSRIGDENPSYQGEINETTHAGFLTSCGGGPLVLRGANINRYSVRSSARAVPLRLDIRKFAESVGGEKATHNRFARVGFQRSAPQNNYRRLIAAPVDKDEFCFDTVSYFLPHECALSGQLLLAFLNSELLDWFFDIGSTNSKVNEYRLNQLPIPRFSSGRIPAEWEAVDAACNRGDWAGLSEVARNLIRSRPERESELPAAIAHAIERLVAQVCDLERRRNLETQAERSRLDPRAATLQAVIDAIIYECFRLDETAIAIVGASLLERRR